MRLPRHTEIWLWPYILDRCRTIYRSPIQRIWVAIADHYEPFWNKADISTARQRVSMWLDQWPKVACNLSDSIGSPPKYSFFYPEEEYRREFIDSLSEMVRIGIADVEVHIHHNGEGRTDFVNRMSAFIRTLHEQHGLLREVEGRLKFGFIHGNWALDNSLPGGAWCGLNDEITLLRDLGCYADFTMPSGNSYSQSKMLNKIYWCTDDPERPKSYDYGVDVQSGSGRQGDLLMIPGPFGLRWKERTVPRMETGEIAANDNPTGYRVHRWLELAPRIGGDVFLKLFTHGAQEQNAAALLGGSLQTMYTLLLEEAQRRSVSVYFVSAWQMYNAVTAIVCSRDPTSTVLTSAVPIARQP